MSIIVCICNKKNLSVKNKRKRKFSIYRSTKSEETDFSSSSKVKQVEQLETRPLCTKELHDGYKNCFSSQLEE